MRCPCAKKSETTTYADCCQPYHSGFRVPATAEALMRSRYTAFALHNEAYLLATWHPSTRPGQLGLTAGPSSMQQTWTQLKIVAAHDDGERATVSFVARSLIGGRSQTLAEVSRFVREGGRWLYVDGVVD
jgi:SEC-C motif domain protein